MLISSTVGSTALVLSDAVEAGAFWWLAILAATGEEGPFAGKDLSSGMVTLQASNGTTALTALLLAAVITERATTHEEIKRMCLRFAEMVAQLEPRPASYELPPEEPPP